MRKGKFNNNYNNNKNRRNFKKPHKALKEEEKKDPPPYYECNKPGYIKSNCPNLKKKEKGMKKKAYLTTWSEDEVDSDVESIDE